MKSSLWGQNVSQGSSNNNEVTPNYVFIFIKDIINPEGLSEFPAHYAGCTGLAFEAEVKENTKL